MYREDAIANRPHAWSLMLGTLLIVLGVVAMIVPFVATMTMILVIGWLLIFAAIEQAVYAFRSRGEGGLFFKGPLALLYCAVGIMVLRRPVSGAVAVTAIVGTLFIIDGVMEIALGFQLGRRSRRSGWLFAGGILSLVLGIIIWRAFPLSALWVIGVFVGIRLVFKGIEHIMRSRNGKPRVDQRESRITPAA